MKNFKAGKYVNQGTYKSFQPEFINRDWLLDNMELLTLLGQADRQLGRLDMYSDYIPNIDLFISMHIVKEATKSSKIERTKINIDEVLLDKDEITEEKRDDWQVVQNYISALNTAIEKLKKLPFSSRLIKATHKVLLSNVRGKHKLPGEYRSSQDWIGGASITDATFIPPTFDTINEYMSDIEKFVHNTEIYFPDILKIALIHYQFETVHPFLDGNGRVGRLMITLYLVEKGILKKPILYLSEFFEKNRTLYYDNLMRVREKDDIVQWFKFFLVGVIETAKNGISTFDGILKLQKDIDNKIQGLGSRANNALTIINHLYQKPLFDAQLAKQVTNLSMPSVYKLINELEELNIIREVTGGKRGKFFVFDEYLELFQ